MAAKFEICTDKQKMFRFRLVASNGQIIATGQGYKSKDSCKKDIESVRKGAPGATIVDTTA